MIRSNKPKIITPAMTILDVVSRYRETEAVFKRYDKLTGACLCCQSLFKTLQEVARHDGLNLNALILALEHCINAQNPEGLPENPAGGPSPDTPV